MPGLVKNHDHGDRLSQSPFMAELEADMAEDDVMVLVHGYLAGGVVGKDKCITKPDDRGGRFIPLGNRAMRKFYRRAVTPGLNGLKSCPASCHFWRLFWVFYVRCMAALRHHRKPQRWAHCCAW